MRKLSKSKILVVIALSPLLGACTLKSQPSAVAAKEAVEPVKEDVKVTEPVMLGKPYPGTNLALPLALPIDE